MRNKKEPVGVFTYKSPNTGEYVIASQYIAELIVNRKALKRNVSLTYKYWNKSSEWQKEFKSQVTQAAILLKKYDSRAIIKALMIVGWCWSLRNVKLLAVIDREQKKINLNRQYLQQSGPIVITKTTSFTRRPCGIKNKLSKLRELDGKTENL